MHIYSPLIKVLCRKMNPERKINESVTKHLSRNKCKIKLESKIEQAETKSHFFGNKDKMNKNIKCNEKGVSAKLANIKKTSKNAELLENEITNSTSKKTTIKRSSRQSKGLPSIEVIKKKSVKVNHKSNKIETPTNEEEIPSTSKKIKEDLSEGKWEPGNWKIILENIRNMRSNDKAPVDTMGCHKCADENADEKTQRFHKLIALMLSSQTKDETTYHAMLRLREHNLTPEVVCSMKANVLENILHPVSFYKNKAKYMQQTSKILVEKYSSDIPNNIKELVALPGVGPKMAHICMATAWHRITGIGVDVHVHRISNRLGWLPKPTKEPEKTRLALEAWLPQDLWSEVNHLLVGFGQTICTPLKPKCTECLNFKICPSAVKITKKEVSWYVYVA